MPEIDFAGFMATIGATVMGRATFDQALARGWLSAGGTKIVMTTRRLARAPKGVEAWPGSGPADVRALAERLRGELAGSGKDVWLMGGGKNLQAFHAADLVDRWELALIPVLLGDGIPLFPERSERERPLALLRSRVLSNGVLETCYAPAGAPGPARPSPGG